MLSPRKLLFLLRKTVYISRNFSVNTHMSFSGEGLPSFVSKLCDVFEVPFLEQLIRYTRNNLERRTLKDLYFISSIILGKLHGLFLRCGLKA
jgi:hypothetical protein